MDILVQKAKRHDKDAFSQLIQDNTKAMYKVAIAILKNDEDAADAIQDTILSCWEKIHTLKKDEFFKTWLIRILINHCNAMYRQRTHFVAEEEVAEQMSIEHGFLNVEWREMLNNLDEKYRTVLVLYYAEGFKVREIAQILNIEESAVKARLSVAREKMEILYSEEGR